MADEKTLSFNIVIDGVSNENVELQKLNIQFQNLNKEFKDLQKTIKQQGGIGSNEQLHQLAALRTEMDKNKDSTAYLVKVVNSAPDSLNRMRAELIKLKDSYANASAAAREKMAPAILELNKKISNSEQAIGVHQRNVGNYPQLFSMIPGPVGQAANAIGGFSTKLAMIGPVGAVIAAGIAAISAPVIGFLKWTQEGMDLLAVKTSEFTASIRVLKGELANLGKNEIAEANKPGGILSFFGSVWDIYKKVELGGTKIFAPEIGKKIEDTANKMKDAAAAAKVYTEKIHEIEQAEIKEIVPRAKATEGIRAARLAYQEGNGTITERLELFDKALIAENKITDQEIKNATDRANAIYNYNIEKAKTIPLTRAEQRVEEEAFAKVFELQSASEARLIRFSGLRKKLQKEDEKANEALLKKDVYLKEGTAEWDKAVDAIVKNIVETQAWIDLPIEEKLKTIAQARDIMTEVTRTPEGYGKVSTAEAQSGQAEQEAQEAATQKREDDWAAEMDLATENFRKNKEAQTAIAKKETDKQDAIDKKHKQDVIAGQNEVLQSFQNLCNGILAAKSANLNAQMEKELSKEGLTQAQQLAIRKKYAKEQQRLAIIDAIINTAQGVVRAFKDYAFPYSLIIAALVAALGGVEIASIASQKLAKSGKIAGGTQVAPDRNGDNTLVLAKQGEVILNERHQAMLGGSRTFKRIGVPGFAESGIVGGDVNPEINASMNYEDMINAMAASMSEIRVNMYLSDLHKAENELTVTQQRSAI